MNETAAGSARVETKAPADVVVRGKASGFLQTVESGSHRFQVDEPINLGGTDLAPGPYEYLLAALGSCTSMTISLYARRKNWPLDEVTVSLRHSRIHARDCEECETKVGLLDHIEVEVSLSGELSREQHSKLMEIAGKCPVHRTLKSEIAIDLREVKETEFQPNE